MSDWILLSFSGSCKLGPCGPDCISQWTNRWERLLLEVRSQSSREISETMVHYNYSICKGDKLYQWTNLNFAKIWKVIAHRYHWKHCIYTLYLSSCKTFVFYTPWTGVIFLYILFHFWQTIKNWFFDNMSKLLALLQSLLDGLSEVDDNLWKDVKKLQRRWIGNCDGTRIDFKLKVQIRVKQGYSEVSFILPNLRICPKLIRYHKLCLWWIKNVAFCFKHFILCIGWF